MWVEGWGSSNGREVQKERLVKMCWKGTGKNQARQEIHFLIEKWGGGLFINVFFWVGFDVCNLT
jgi:hypothetical protein